MTGRGTEAGERARAITYCIVPRELAAKLHDPLREHFAEDASVEVIVEQRARDRRHDPERRQLGSTAPSASTNRRRIRGPGGRRVAERRAPALAVGPPVLLPRRARPYTVQILFLERLAPTSQQAEDLDTARLVTRIQSGDSDCFAELYMRYFDRVYGYLRVAFKNEHEAEDAAQHVFMKVYEAIGRYDRGRAPFRAWLFAIVRNHAIDELKRLQRIDVADQADIERRREHDQAEAQLDVLNWISDRELLLFIERLPLAQRQVLMLRYMLDLTPSEVARLLDLTPDHVRKLQSRALEFLRARLAALGRSSSGRPVRILRARKMAPVLRVRRFALIDRL